MNKELIDKLERLRTKLIESEDFRVGFEVGAKWIQTHASKVSEWISVNDRLPSEHQDVLVYYYGNRNSIHFPNSQFMKQSSFYDNKFECGEEVTHWRSLPDAPKVGQVR